MRTGVQGVVRGIGYFDITGQFIIPCTTTPGPVTCAGAMARFIVSCTYSATGVYTVVFGPDFQFVSGPVFDTEAQSDVLADWFTTLVVGGYNATTKTVVIQCHRSGTAQAVAAAVGSQIVVNVGGSDSAGK